MAWALTSQNKKSGPSTKALICTRDGWLDFRSKRTQEMDAKVALVCVQWSPVLFLQASVRVPALTEGLFSPVLSIFRFLLWAPSSFSRYCNKHSVFGNFRHNICQQCPTLSLQIETKYHHWLHTPGLEKLSVRGIHEQWAAKTSDLLLCKEGGCFLAQSPKMAKGLVAAVTLATHFLINTQTRALCLLQLELSSQRQLLQDLGWGKTCV